MFGISVFMSLFEQFEQNFMGGVRADMKKCATCVGISWKTHPWHETII